MIYQTLLEYEDSEIAGGSGFLIFTPEGGELKNQAHYQIKFIFEHQAVFDLESITCSNPPKGIINVPSELIRKIQKRLFGLARRVYLSDNRRLPGEKPRTRRV